MFRVGGNANFSVFRYQRQHEFSCRNLCWPQRYFASSGIEALEISMSYGTFCLRNPNPLCQNNVGISAMSNRV